MPLASIGLRNFKCFADSADIPLAPLTIIFGRNNSGKSSILHSLLILKQTLDSPEYGPRMNLGGRLYQAGAYSDVVHLHRSSQHIVIRLGFSLAGPKPGAIELEFSSDEPQAPQLVRLTVDKFLEIRRGRGRGGPYEMVVDGKPMGGERKANFAFGVDRFLPLVGDEPSHVGAPSKARARARRMAKELLEYAGTIFRDLRAVGAFRPQPERGYDFHGRVPTAVDSAGQYAIQALIEDQTKKGARRNELFRSVNQWLKVVGNVRLLPVRLVSKAARRFEVRVRDLDSGRWANFADVGFGIGQALPVLVEGLRTLAEGTFLVQEPEIHLHPDAQLAMADFLVGLAKTGRRVIAETHSEHFLLRVRHLIVSRRRNGRAPGLAPSDVSLVHVAKRPDGQSVVRKLEIDELGQVKNWPKGFMEEATDERMAILREMAGGRKA